ncbi:MAG: TonB family protein [Chitinophagaceae bacterium]|nr:TonB family protein [Chitinophagaceae bacterium]
MNKYSNDSKIYSAEDILNYLSGSMPPGEMHAMEKAALEDPFLADAMEGYRLAKTSVNTTDIDMLHARLAIRRKPAKVVALYKRRWFRTVAAMLLLSAGLLLAYSLLFRNRQPQLAVNKDRKEEKPGTLATPSAPTPPPPETLTASTPAPGLQDGFKPGARQNTSQVIPEKKEAAAFAETVQKDEMQYMASDSLTGVIAMAPSAPVSKEQEQKIDEALQGRVSGISVPEKRDETVPLADQKKNSIDNDTVLSLAQERVVAGYDKQKMRRKTATAIARASKPLSPSGLDTTEATPSIGVNQYITYLFSNRQKPATEAHIEGDVIVSFQIGRSGKPEEFKIIRSLSPLLDKEAIRLIREGPPWKLLTKRKGRATVTVRF